MHFRLPPLLLITINASSMFDSVAFNGSLADLEIPSPRDSFPTEFLAFLVTSFGSQCGGRASWMLPRDFQESSTTLAAPRQHLVGERAKQSAIGQKNEWPSGGAQFLSFSPQTLGGVWSL